MDTSHATIEKLFYKQMRNLTQRSIRNESLDFQFSDRWM